MSRREPKTALPVDRSRPVHDGLPNPQRMLSFAMATAVLDGALRDLWTTRAAPPPPRALFTRPGPA